MCRNLLAIAVFILTVVQTYADPVINSFNASPVSNGREIKVSTTAATTVNFTVTVSRAVNPASGSWEDVIMTMNIVLRGAGAADEVLSPAVAVGTADFNSGAFASKAFSVSIPANKQGKSVSLRYTYFQFQTGLNVGPFFSSTYFVTVLNTTPPPGPDTRIRLVPDVKSFTSMYKENNSYAELPANTVMIGRYHNGDENGSTNYQYATLKAINYLGEPVAGTITVEAVAWSAEIGEKNHIYVVPVNYVMTGRIHVGDENQKTRYRHSIVKFNGKATTVLQTQANGSITVYLPNESKTGSWTSPENMVIYGRKHWGDENGETEYYFSTIYVNP